MSKMQALKNNILAAAALANQKNLPHIRTAAFNALKALNGK